MKTTSTTDNLTANNPATKTFFDTQLVQDRIDTYNNPNGSIWGPETGTN